MGSRTRKLRRNARPEPPLTELLQPSRGASLVFDEVIEDANRTLRRVVLPARFTPPSGPANPLPVLFADAPRLPERAPLLELPEPVRAPESRRHPLRLAQLLAVVAGLGADLPPRNKP